MRLLPTPLTLLAIAALVLFVLYAVRRIRRLRAVRPHSWVVVELHGSVTDFVAPLPRLRRWFDRRPQPVTVAGLRRLARQITHDPNVDGLLIQLNALSCGWATAESLRDVLRELRDNGKRVVAFLPQGGMTRELFVALAAEKIYVPPQAGVAPVGVASGTTFYRTLLERGGIEAEVLARREFKSAVEPFIRDGMSEPSREQTVAILDAVHAALVKAISDGRLLTTDAARAIVDEGPYRARDALEKKLIDGVAYDDEIPTLLGTKPERLVRLSRYQWSRGPGYRMSRGQRVGIVEVRGPITSEARMALGRVADAERIIGALRSARASDAIGAVVLYVNSPGGSALASDAIAREVERLREKKPVVAYFSDVAASGGYYVAAKANAIVAQPLTVTGSIGVFALRFVVQRALEKLGLSHETIRRGARADIMSPYRHWTEEERATLDREIDGFYTDFVNIVAQGRKRSFDEIEPLARGRVYAGVDAKTIGLVDQLGGLNTAIDHAASLAKLTRRGDPVLVMPPREMPPPPEAPAVVQAFAENLGPALDVVHLALNSSRERLFAFYEDTSP